VPGSSAIKSYTVKVCKPTGCAGSGLRKAISVTVDKHAAHLVLTGYQKGSYLVLVVARNATASSAPIRKTIKLL
jgi:hypothetical protein